MSAAAVILFPFIGILLLSQISSYRISSWLNTLFSFLSFVGSLFLLFKKDPPGSFFLVDELNIVFILLTNFIGFTTALFSQRYIAHEIEIGHLSPPSLRFYHSMYQALLFGMNLALCSNNIGLMWVSIEMATLSTVLMVGIYRTTESLEASWKYFILGGVGIALALFGTFLFYISARPTIGEGLAAMAWTNLFSHAAYLDSSLVNIGFIFILIGYGTKVGLFPLHGWLPDAHAEGPTPISAVLSGLLLNVALYAILRFKILLSANPHALQAGPLLTAMGLASVLFAALMFYKRRDIKRLFAYSSIEHMGIISFAFGIGGALANFAGLLHMSMHSLTKSAIFFAIGYISQIKRTQKIADLSGLTSSHPVLGWGLVFGVLAIAGLPPMGVFMSEFLVLSSAFARSPLLAACLAVGLITALGALILKLVQVSFGEPRGDSSPIRSLYLPMFSHFLLVFAAGVYIPPRVVEWFQHCSVLLK
ncbi:hydrogenase 4 subunit F [Candidatus Methylacidiphilum infernorum]|uniref:Hydrogenase-4 component F homolog n=1 Tax=Methylacidiphilum infernorum (isolate V4) TaxID=481448 RepID=HYFF_METI4|nr:hydrogenase 4 subunit F [Candidatus Methylacidiphilum infernorum]A9QPJ1.1 RecName: Full=Hydrogenase-4 component F homolog [Methylacidiphilum infernorum V4]ABX56649.1 putative formate hydrogenlyase [Methylacidiphilum infernorum V4]ACD82571.1 Formate hydrogenlyase subunit 3 [Methylacidiphilum infernorum V4]